MKPTEQAVSSTVCCATLDMVPTLSGPRSPQRKNRQVWPVPHLLWSWGPPGPCTCQAALPEPHPACHGLSLLPAIKTGREGSPAEPNSCDRACPSLHPVHPWPGLLVAHVPLAGPSVCSPACPTTIWDSGPRRDALAQSGDKPGPVLLSEGPGDASGWGRPSCTDDAINKQKN